MQTITTTQVFEFELSRQEREAIREMLIACGLKAKITVLKEARVEVKIQIDLDKGDHAASDDPAGGAGGA